MKNRGLLVVLSGPAGSGKTTLAESMIDLSKGRMVRSVTATTRSPRKGEVDGIDYYFLSRDTFEEYIDQGRFVEHVEFNGNLYGSLKSELEKKLEEGKIVVLVIEVRGAEEIRTAFPNAVSIFVLPPSQKELRQRLCGRGTECISDIENRLEIARSEISCIGEYDYLVINDCQDEAVKDLTAIVNIARTHHIRGDELQAWLDDRYQGWHDDCSGK